MQGRPGDRVTSEVRDARHLARPTAASNTLLVVAAPRPEIRQCHRRNRYMLSPEPAGPGLGMASAARIRGLGHFCCAGTRSPTRADTGPLLQAAGQTPRRGHRAVAHRPREGGQQVSRAVRPRWAAAARPGHRGEHPRQPDARPAVGYRPRRPRTGGTAGTTASSAGQAVRRQVLRLSPLPPLPGPARDRGAHRPARDRGLHRLGRVRWVLQRTCRGCWTSGASLCGMTAPSRRSPSWCRWPVQICHCRRTLKI
jgi:hypothetical protein